MTAFGLVFVAVAGVAFLLVGRRAIPLLLVLSLPFEGSSVINLGGSGLSPFHAVALIATADLVVGSASRRFTSPPGIRWLVAFVLAAALITAVAPTLFRGQPVLSPRGGIDLQIQYPAALDYSLGNAIQVTYLILGAAVVVVIVQAMQEPDGPRRLAKAYAAALALGLLLAGWQYLSTKGVLSWPAAFWQNSPGREYVTKDVFQRPRVYGSYPEPSLLAVHLLAAGAFGLSCLAVPERRWRVTGGLLLVGGLYLFYVGRAGTAIAAGGMLIAFALVTACLRVMRRQWVATVALVVGPLLAVLLVTAVALSGVVGDVLSDVADKSASTSYSVRTAADVFSLQLVPETYGIGVGLGSNRPSSMFTLLLSCVGIVGTGLFLAWLFVVFKRGRSSSSPLAGPIWWGAAAVTATKFLSAPDLGAPIFWVSVSLLSGIAVASRHAASSSEAASAEAGQAGQMGAAGGRPSVQAAAR